MAEIQEGIKLIIREFDARFLTPEVIFLISFGTFVIIYFTLQSKKIKENIK